MEGRDARPQRRRSEEYERDHHAIAREAATSRPASSTCTRDYKYEGHAWGMAIDLNVLRRLQRLRRRLPGREQHPGGGQGAGGARPRDALDPRRPLLRGRRSTTRSVHHQPMPCMHCENAPCEVGLPRGRHRAQRRGPERHGLQPLRRHALLLEQLPLQGAALQLLPVPGLRHAEPQAACATPTSRVRSRGVMEKCTYCVQRIQQAQDRRAQREAAPIADGEITHRLPAGLPGRRRSCSATSTTRSSARLEAEGAAAQLRRARRT